MNLRLGAVVVCFLCNGLAAAGTAAAEAQVRAGMWRVTFDTPLGELPFNLELSRGDDAWSSHFINGPERMRAEITRVHGGSLVIEFPSYNSSLAGAMVDDDTMRGVARFNRRNGPQVIPFTARHGQTHRFFPRPASGAKPVAGRWALTSRSPAADEPRQGLLELQQDGSLVVGTSIHTTGDSRFLTGELRGNALYLSTFDGGTGSLWHGKVNSDGTLAGRNYSLGMGVPATWSAKRDANATLADPTKLTYLKDGYERLAFTFPDIDGNLVSLSDSRFRDKVVVVVIGGSWCPTCHDETAFFSPFFNQHRHRGLEAIGLMYEYSADYSEAVEACRKFLKRYDIQYPLLVAGTSDKQEASETLPMINAVLVYPTMIFIDRKGAVRHIHTGFPGPATGERHERFKRDFEDIIERLLAEDA